MKMHRLSYLLAAILLAELSFGGCSSLGQPSNDEILKHVLCGGRL